MVTIAFLTTRLTMVDFTRVISDGLSSRRGERDFYMGLWRTCFALSCVVMFTGAAVANDTSQLLAAKPNPAASKPKSQQDMMKMLDDYENNVSHGGGTTGAQPMSPQGMGRGYGGAPGMMRRPGMRGGGAFAGRGLQPRPVGNSSGMMLQALKQKFERMRQNQPGIMQMLQGQMQQGQMQGAEAGGAGGSQFMQMLQQKMRQAPPPGQMQRFGQAAPSMNPGMMASPRPGGGMSPLGAQGMMQRPGMTASQQGGSFRRLGNAQRSSPPASNSTLQDLESQMNAQYGH